MTLRQERFKWEMIAPVLERLLTPPAPVPTVPRAPEIVRIQQAWAANSKSPSVVLAVDRSRFFPKSSEAFQDV